jgi:hypothetical protein
MPGPGALPKSAPVTGSGSDPAPPPLSDSLQARVAHSRHRVFPVPVGLSSKAFLPCSTQPHSWKGNRST